MSRRSLRLLSPDRLPARAVRWVAFAPSPSGRQPAGPPGRRTELARFAWYIFSLKQDGTPFRIVESSSVNSESRESQTSLEKALEICEALAGSKRGLSVTELS